VSHPAEVLAWVDARADEMAVLVETLVAIDTENPPGRNLRACAEVVFDAMSRLALSPELLDVAPAGDADEPCIVRGGVGTGTRTVYFHGHFDVVPAQTPEQFRPRRADGRITGRGTADMKGGLVSMLYGAAAARELGLLGDGRVVFHVVSDEETGSVAGSASLQKTGRIDPGALAMLTAEPTGGVVWNASRGAITLRVHVRGREAHVGQASLGVNAFEHMIHVADALASLARERAAKGSTLVVGGASGSGATFNSVPGAAWFSVDCRFDPENELEAERTRLTDTIATAAAEVEADVTVEVVQEAPSARTKPGHPAAEALARSVELVEGARPAIELCPGVLETRWYAQLGIPAFAYGPGRLDVSHGPDEHVEEGALRRCAAVYALAAGELLGSRSEGGEQEPTPRDRP
jgi:succinyl-diaminopimelate desuccinylase